MNWPRFFEVLILGWVGSGIAIYLSYKIGTRDDDDER